MPPPTRPRRGRTRRTTGNGAAQSSAATGGGGAGQPWRTWGLAGRHGASPPRWFGGSRAKEADRGFYHAPEPVPPWARAVHPAPAGFGGARPMGQDGGHARRPGPPAPSLGGEADRWTRGTVGAGDDGLPGARRT